MSEEVKNEEKPYVPTNLLHLNGNVLCAIDVETTGTDPMVHEIIEVCFLPLDANLEPRRDIPPFDIQIKPENHDVIEWEAMNVTKIDYLKLCQTGMDKYDAADLFEKWVEKFKLDANKRLSPLAQNWIFDCQFIRQWLGNKTFEFYIDGRYRDVMSCALYENDKADRKNERIPFPKVNLSYLASQLKIEHGRAHNALYDCIATAQIYAELVKGRLPVSAANL